MMTRRAILPISLTAFVLLSVLVCGCRPASTPPPPRVPIVYAPSPIEAVLKPLGLDNQVVLVEFGQAACKMTGDALDQVIRLSKDKSIPHLAFLRVDVGPSREQAEQFYQGSAPGLPFVYDNGSVAKAFGATAIPTTLLVDKFGRVRYRGNFPDEVRLKKWVQELYDQKSDAGPDVTLFGIVSADLTGMPAATKLPDLTGKVSSLQSFAGSKGLLVVFADVSCPFANSALGDLPKVTPTMAGLGISTVVVNIDDPEDAVLKTYAERETGTPVLYDATGATKENWRIEMVPTVVLFTPDGKAVYRSGAVWADLAAATEKQLGLEPGTIVFQAEGTGMG